MQANQIQQTRTLSFPLSHEQIEVTTYKNADGTFKNAEVMMFMLKKAFLQVNDAIIGSRVQDSNNIFSFRILSSNEIQLLEFKVMPGTNKVDYATEKLIAILPTSDIGQIRHIVISAITTFFGLFAHYYDTKSVRDEGLQPVVNEDLLPLLRSSNGAKIKYLDDLLSLYLALNGQTYFDVACHAMISGAYTFGSLFSITGLYHAANSKLNGRTMVTDARQRMFKKDYNVRDKGEIHTKQGLTVLYSRQFRLRPKRGSQLKRDVEYEIMSLIDEDDDLEKESNRPSTSDHGFRRVYEQVKEYKLLTWSGLQELEAFHHEFLDIINKDRTIQERFKKEVKIGNISSLINILNILDDLKFVSLFRKIDVHLVHKHDKLIMNKIFAIDLFEVSNHKEVFTRNLIRLLGLLESEPLESDLTDSIVKQFQTLNDCTDLVLKLINEFLEIIG